MHALLVTQSDSFAGAWQLDPEPTTVSFETTFLWLVKVKGAFGNVRGHGVMYPEGRVTGSVAVEMASVDTKITKRDDHLRSADFFDVDRFPTMDFTVTDGRITHDGRVFIHGELRIHGNSRPIDLVADVTEVGTSIVLSSNFEIDRSDWGVGLTKGPGKSRSLKTRVQISLRFCRA